MTTRPQAEIDRDLAMIRDSDHWPHGTRLLLMRVVSGVIECQTLIVVESRTLYLVNANMWDFEALTFAPRICVTPEELIADGWMVD